MDVEVTRLFTLTASWVTIRPAMPVAERVGLVDDVRPLGVGIHSLAQGIAATITALWGGMPLTDFGAQGRLGPARAYLVRTVRAPRRLGATARRDH